MVGVFTVIYVNSLLSLTFYLLIVHTLIHYLLHRMVVKRTFDLWSTLGSFVTF